MFQQHDNWWDLLCVLDLPNCTGHVYSAEERKFEDGSGISFPSSKSSMVAPSGGSSSGGGSGSSSAGSGAAGSSFAGSSYEDSPHFAVDNKFIQGVISGIGARISEDWVRQQFYDYTSSIISHAQDLGGMYLDSTKLEEKTKRFLEANAARIAIIDKTTEFLSLPTHPFVWGYNNTEYNAKKESVEEAEDRDSIHPKELFPSTDSVDERDGKGIVAEKGKAKEIEPEINNFYDGILLKSYVRKLQYECNIDPRDEAPLYFMYLDCRLQSESALQGLLVLLPESTGGLFPIAVGLFHRNPMVRKSAVNILENIRKFQSTMTAFHSLNPFLLEAFERQLGKLKDGTIDKEIARMKEKEKSRRQRMDEKFVASGVGASLSAERDYMDDDLFDEEETHNFEYAGGSPPIGWSSSSSSDTPTGSASSPLPLASMFKRTLNFLASPIDHSDHRFTAGLDALEMLP